MSNTIRIINTVLPIILMLGIGMLCRKKALLSREGIGALKRVVVDITLPAMLLGAFSSMEFTYKNIILLVTIYIACIVALLLGKVLRSLLKEESRFMPYLMTGFEAGMLGYALMQMLYGSEAISDFASVDIGQVLFVFTMYKVLLGMEGENGKVSGKQIVKEMLVSPVIIACVVGILISATGLYSALAPSGISSILDTCCDFISAPTAAVILITIGYDLVLKDVAWGAVGKVIISRVIVMVIVRIALGAAARIIGMGSSLDMALNILCILPPPYVIPVFADGEKQRTYVSSALSVCTLATMIAFFVLTIIG